MRACMDRQRDRTPRCYVKEHLRSQGSMRAWTWEDHDNNAACEICTKAPLGGLHEINQCLRVYNVSTLWLLNPKDSDWANQEKFDEENNAARPLQREPPAFGGDAAQDTAAFEYRQSGSTPVEE